MRILFENGRAVGVRITARSFPPFKGITFFCAAIFANGRWIVVSGGFFCLWVSFLIFAAVATVVGLGPGETLAAVRHPGVLLFLVARYGFFFVGSASICT